MQDKMTMGEAHEAGQRRDKLRWLWLPTGLLVAVGALLFRVQPGWGVLGLGLATLWMVLAALGFGIREGMSWAGSGVLGYGPDVRSVGLFAAYRQRPTLLAYALIYLGMLLVGVLALALPSLDTVDGGFMLLGLLFCLVAGPVELCNWQLARRHTHPTMRQVLALWLPALLLGQLAHWLALDAMALVRPGLVMPLHYWCGPVFGAAYLLVLVGVHRSTLAWQQRLDQANVRADAADTARRLAEAQLAVLQAQIEPHFLYNTLATVQYLLKGEPAMADFLLTQLIRYLRLAMPSMRQYSSTLGREFELTEAYLQITRLRMGGRLDVDLDLPVALQALEFPPLVLQTLVENAIKHGVEPKAGPVRIRVFASRSEAGLEVGVQDDGVGLGGAPTQGGGTGLRNIRERLQGIYGDRARLSVLGLPQGGVLARVTIAIPQD